ncbi:glyoxalase superfamily protein [Enterovibrio coralii]|uniref:Glyoxalase-related protein domain-containing protein n=1 Tax=Enterovibrio coralii TaxID=294935 RepID=A0A135IAD2_9GAMM|nr:glyoxalase superfamily protein [Enterovibrio coralii]KXF82358.1 hypothetical protein ATN88_09415 [Enterovibrio coralii]
MFDIKALKHQAKLLKRQKQCSHMQALELVAREQGFDNWHTLLRFAEDALKHSLLSKDVANKQQVALEVPMYSSVPVGWLIGRNTYSIAVQYSYGRGKKESNELEVPMSCWGER